MSQWLMYDVEMKRWFGPVIFCSVVVVQSQTSSSLAPPTAELLNAVVPPGGQSGVDVGLSTEDLFAFVKTLEMTAAKKPGPLAVPTNTPLG